MWNNFYNGLHNSNILCWFETKNISNHRSQILPGCPQGSLRFGGVGLKLFPSIHRFLHSIPNSGRKHSMECRKHTGPPLPRWLPLYNLSFHLILLILAGKHNVRKSGETSPENWGITVSFIEICWALLLSVSP